jgi:uncharacterized membrane protein
VENQGALRLLAATFATRDGGGRALATLAPALGAAKIAQAAVLVREADGKVRFVETHDRSVGTGALQGAGVGALVGLVGIVFGPIGLVTMPVGAAAGAIAAKLRDTGFDDDDLRAMGEDLKPGTSALLAAVSWDALTKAQTLLETIDAERIVVKQLDAKLAELLDAEAESAAATE